MKFSKHVRFTLWICLVALNLILRLPITPHEIGWDTFGIHILANSISTFGHAEWWVHPLSIFGMYPYSYASAVPFILSGISQSTGVDMQWTIWLFCTLIGIFSIFVAYIMAELIKNDDVFKFLVAFGYSLVPGMLNFSTWQLSTRGLFIVLLPLFIYLLLKTRNSLRYVMLTFILFMVLTVTHHMIYFVILVIFSYVIVVTLYKLRKYTNFKIPNNFVNISFLISFIFMLSIPIFTYLFISETGSKYTWVYMLARTYIRYIGVLIVFALGGFIYLSLRHHKGFEEWFLLLILLFFAPLLYIYRYSKWFILIFAIILAGIGLTNVAKTYIQKGTGRYALSIIIISLLLSVSFSGFYQCWHTNIPGRPTYNERYMEHATYIGALWIKDSIDKAMVSNDDLIGRRVFAISEVPTLTGAGAIDLTYGFTNITDISISKNSPLSTEFYMDNPYVRTPHTPYTWSYFSILNDVDFDDRWGKTIISRFNLSYVIENEDIGDNKFIRSVHREKNNVYSNGKIRVWCLD